MIQFGLFLKKNISKILCILCVGDQGAAAAFLQVGKHQYPTGWVGLSPGSLQFSWIPRQ